MSEMLGNQYFMARNYKEAIRELEPIYIRDSSNKAVHQKLIIGYTQTGELKKALELFILLENDDIESIINADPIFNDYPCSEFEKHLHHFPSDSASPDINIYNGILWLFCNPKISLEFLKRAIIDFPEIDGIKKIVNIILQQINRKTS